MKKLSKILLAMSLGLSLAGCSSNNTKEENSSKETESESVEETDQEEVQEETSQYEGIEADLDLLKVSVDKHTYGLPCEDNQVSRVQTIKDGLIIYTVEEVASDGIHYETQTINSCNILTGEITEMLQIQDGMYVDGCTLYQGTPLYYMWSITDYHDYLMYGNETLRAPGEKYSPFSFIELNQQIYILENTPLNNFNNWIEKIYSFNGTLNCLYEKQYGEEFYSDEKNNNLFITTLADHTLDFHYQLGNTLVDHIFEARDDCSGPICQIGEYVLYGNRVLCNSTSILNKDYSVVYMNNGGSMDGSSNFLMPYDPSIVIGNQIVDIGNNMFLYEMEDTDQVYKGIIDEENERIILMDSSVKVQYNFAYCDGDGTVYVYYDDGPVHGYSKDWNNQKKFKLYTISYES